MASYVSLEMFDVWILGCGVGLREKKRPTISVMRRRLIFDILLSGGISCNEKDFFLLLLSLFNPCCRLRTKEREREVISFVLEANN